MQQLLAKLGGFHQVPPALEEFLRRRVIIQTFAKKEVILKVKRVCRYVYFIEKGLVRHVVVNGRKTYTPWILQEGDIVTSVRSFLFQEPATDSVVTIEATTAILLSFEDLVEGCRLFPELAIIREKVKDKYYAQKEDRDQQLGTLDMEQRYQYLLENNPELTVRVPVDILASYLGMSSKKLYDIRKELTALL